MELLLATRSRHKVVEIRRILARVPELEVLDLDEAGIPYRKEEEGIERFHTFRENAIAKARHFRELSGLPTVADDSGLEVAALDGAPGVRSKRFAPEEGLEGVERDQANNRHLVRLLAGVPRAERTARYVCVAVLEDGSEPPPEFRGEAPGLIVEEPRGEGGFGYDPHFLDPELGVTFAEISREEKNARSHRGKAFGALAVFLMERSPGSGADARSGETEIPDEGQT